jgi:hypothetical protein
MIDFPHKTKMFSPEEKRVLLARLNGDDAEPKGDKNQVFLALLDWKIWVA